MTNAPFTHMQVALDQQMYAPEDTVVTELVATAALSDNDRRDISDKAAKLVRDIRSSANPGLMEVFLAEYGLSTDEGVALMCLAEALLRVPDADTIDALIEDKIAPSDWGKHLGQSTSPLVNASTWGLLLTGRVLDERGTNPIGALRGAIKRLGEPVIRTAVGRAMKEMGRQFVLGEDIHDAMTRAARMEAKGYSYSYDMLGEAAKTDADAARYHLAYSDAISAIAARNTTSDIRDSAGISIKLSALHPRYEIAQHERVKDQLIPRLLSLALLAKSAGMGMNIDAEEADRLSLSLEVIEAVLATPALAGWDGFGVVVQAYGPRTGAALERLYSMAQTYDRKIMVRLVKGAYWDTEIKRAQVEGVDSFPVFTQKATTDVSYIGNARRLLGMTDRIYPQFATHNAHTVSAVLHMAEQMGRSRDCYEFQRLHGMGENLYDLVTAGRAQRCRIYAPVGAHRDLLAYLVRRLLENGANSSFVNQIVDKSVPAETVAACPFDALGNPAANIPTGADLFAPERTNSKGFDLSHTPTLTEILADRARWQTHQWYGASRLAVAAQSTPTKSVINPARPDNPVGTVAEALDGDIDAALNAAAPWGENAQTRAQVLNAAADSYEANSAEIFALLAREAGKTLPDAVAELREAVDFLRYYATQALDTAAPVGVFTCISPWNFPLAIFTGQIAAALAAGNGVLAKPAEQTPLIACLAVDLMHNAGVPRSALQLLTGGGAVGARLTSAPQIGGVAFTGSTDTAQKIRANMAQHVKPGAPLIAETGGLNAMIVDSTALPEQAVTAIVESAFQSAGQRCSALRCLYVQEEVAEDLLTMLCGAMDELRTADPWDIATDSGPVIDAVARDGILAHIDAARTANRLLHQTAAPQNGYFVAPTLISVDSIADLECEVFGPVLHVATFKASELDAVIDAINATGYGLTFGLQTRIDARVQKMSDRIKAGNIYVNRNQIGAIVGSQPFGGEGLSGTGPKAGGPHYLRRFQAARDNRAQDITTRTLPGPTGESNRLRMVRRAPILCAGPTADDINAQALAVEALGGVAKRWSEAFDAAAIAATYGVSAVLFWGDDADARAVDIALSQRNGPIVPLLTSAPDMTRIFGERHICVDTTAAGGNAALLGAQ